MKWRLAFSVSWGKLRDDLRSDCESRSGTASAVESCCAAELERTIHKALEKDRNLRYQHASEIRADLQRLKRDTDSGRAAVATVAAELKPAKNSPRFRWAVAAGATIVVAGLAVGGWLFFSRKAHALTDKDTIVLADFTNTTEGHSV